MADSWNFLNTGAGPPAWNMALDEALLEAASLRGQPILRFYSWTIPAATFGYFQKFEDVRSMTDLRPLIRRPTGGGLVPHDADWTYSLAVPTVHDWCRMRAVDSYCRVHEWLKQSFQECGIESTLSPQRIEAMPGQCFAGAERFDLLCGDRKMAGAAQRRRKEGLLIQGSIQPPTGAQRELWQTAMVRTSQKLWNVSWNYMSLDDPLNQRAEELAQLKYETRAFNQKR